MMPQPFFPPTEDDDEAVCFFSEETPFRLEDEEGDAAWLQKVIEQEDKTLHLLNFIFCSDEYLHRLNVEYLDHDTLTDVITFHYAELPLIEGDIFISIERVKENAGDFNVSFEQELHRVMAHGLLHLCGYRDKTEEEKRVMRKKEDEALALRKEI